MISSNNKLVEHLCFLGRLKTKRIIEAFEKIDRAGFILPEYKNEAYGDHSLSTGYGVTISQPSTVAFMLELLDLKPGQKVLDVGSGSGWTTALIAHIVGDKGEVFGVEIIDGLIKFGRENLKKHAFRHAKILKARRGLGLAKKALFDRILVSAAANKIPDELVEQLKVGGIMVIPINYSVFKIKRGKDGYEKDEYYGFNFVPLKK